MADERQKKTIYPTPDNVFSWTRACDIKDVSSLLNLSALKTKTNTFADSVDSDETAFSSMCPNSEMEELFFYLT